MYGSMNRRTLLSASLLIPAYIVPAIGLTVAMTSREDDPSARSGHRDDLHALLGEIIGAVAEA